ncbi:MAG: hypothetical protein H7Y06_14290, partial [Opitutaceae bacterium]|nr:hypothetical protein [Opitutaceae bacterium]
MTLRCIFCVLTFATLLLGSIVSARAATLLKYNFEGTNTLTGMTGYFTSTGVAGTSTPTVTAVGTVNGYGTVNNLDVNNTASNGLRLFVNSSAATGTWTAGVDSGILTLLTPNTLTNTGLLTLSFSLRSSRTNPVLVRVESYDATTNLRTGGLRTLIYPASAGSYQRFALDLDKLTPDGTGAFVPNNSKFKVFFEIGNALG